MTTDKRRELLERLWTDAVAAVGGYSAVNNHLDTTKIAPPSRILAVGKAASGMAEGALAHFPGTPTLVVTKTNHSSVALRECAGVTVIESAHPVPDENSLRGGAALLDIASGATADEHILLLVSGGASSLAESLTEGADLDTLKALNSEMLSQGLTIGAMNARRKNLSHIKDGKLISASSARFTVLAISDVEGDDIATIGSGIGDPRRAPERANATLIATNRIARDQAAHTATALGLTVLRNAETLYDDVYALAPQLGETIRNSGPGVLIWGGEPTVVLPDNPGRGGRNQALALATAEHLSGLNRVSLLVAGTDGTDGPTDAAGGLVDGDTWRETARDALARADAGTELAARGAIFTSGPTNTNVMDIAIALVE